MSALYFLGTSEESHERSLEYGALLCFGVILTISHTPDPDFNRRTIITFNLSYFDLMLSVAQAIDEWQGRTCPATSDSGSILCKL